MKKYILLLLITSLYSSCITNETAFSKKALADTFININNNEVAFNQILEENKGKIIVINVWASWCKDCLDSLPYLLELKEKYPQASYVFLSLDKSLEEWKESIERLNLSGNHYFMQSGWEGDFANFLQLRWIPRYLVVDETGGIKVFNATKSTDKQIEQSLKK
ncbi:TlpA family protein disulfide reductase [Tenacibaculum sp. 190524A02b]|uniref:TlpA family protein disulfide reductase n=1 Tax=Tenacibaculum vairaonense TaxID=3137860 RepID=A0ABM9PKH1_9FLAO